MCSISVLYIYTYINVVHKIAMYIFYGQFNVQRQTTTLCVFVCIVLVECLTTLKATAWLQLS